MLSTVSLFGWKNRSMFNINDKKIFIDDFNRPDGIVGNGWGILTDGGSIQHNEFVSANTVNYNGIIRDFGKSKVEIDITNIKYNFSYGDHIILNDDGTGNQYYIRFSYDSNNVTIHKSQSGVGDTVIAQAATTITNGDNLKVINEGSNITLYINNILIVSAPFDQTFIGTKFGIQAEPFSTMTIDAIKMVEL